MKIRIGYVSNSSTSSFVCYGVCVSRDEMKRLLLDQDRDPYDFYWSVGQWVDENGLEALFDDGDTYIGWVVQTDSGCYLGQSTLPSSEIKKIDQDLLDAGLTDEPQIYTGTRTC